MWTVSRSESGQKLVQYLKQKLKDHYSSRHIKRAIESNLCQVNGFTERFASTRLSQGDKIVFNSNEIDSVKKRLFTLENDRILFEDDSFLVYNKPSGMACDKEGILSLFPTYYLVHRLDKGTTGVVILAKDASIKEAMIQQFRAFIVKKEYKALVIGKPNLCGGVIENQLGQINKYQGQTLWGSVKNGKRAKTIWQLEMQSSQLSLVSCFPETGRTHQIRVHMSELGYPILGDFQYGRHVKHPIVPKRMFLHAYKISFIHPITEQTHIVTAEIPDDFACLCQREFG